MMYLLFEERWWS